jgi:TM2 domain-containing membrane protein YozV
MIYLSSPGIFRRQSSVVPESRSTGAFNPIQKEEIMAEQIPGAEKKIVAGILGILLGSFAIHKFYLGYTKTGIIQLVITVVTCGMGGIIGFIEGIIYLTKSDADFVATYVNGKKEWF